MSIRIKELTKFIDQYLEISNFKDYGPNGLQVQGTDKVQRVAFAVSCDLKTIQECVQWKANVLIVHHGLFWRFRPCQTITGPYGERVRQLIKQEINLLGYHLPLDAHLEVGNAVSLAKKLEMSKFVPFGLYEGQPTGVAGKIKSITPHELSKKLEKILHHSVLMSVPETTKKITSIGIITGGANSGWQEAYAQQLDAYLTGEMSEHDWHEAKEAGVAMFAGGHHATERFGIQELMKKVKKEFSNKIETKFFDSENQA